MRRSKLSSGFVYLDKKLYSSDGRRAWQSCVQWIRSSANGRYGCSSLDNKHKALSSRRIEVRPPRSSPLACWRGILISFSLVPYTRHVWVECCMCLSVGTVSCCFCSLVRHHLISQPRFSRHSNSGRSQICSIVEYIFLGGREAKRKLGDYSPEEEDDQSCQIGSDAPGAVSEGRRKSTRQSEES
jgi:hypothetical protein